MKNLIYKEFKLATPLLAYLFLAFSFMSFLPGYPILCGAFFVCFGIFQSYQNGREDNDVLYTVLLPVRKSDVVKAKYTAAIILQLIAFGLFAAFTLVRMTFLPDAAAYVSNVLMNANFVFLAFVLLVFMAFNAVFIGGFFKTAYGFGKPFIAFIVVSFVIIGIAETLHHLPGLGWLNVRDFAFLSRQLAVLLISAVLYVIVSMLSCKASQKRFEKIDL